MSRVESYEAQIKETADQARHMLSGFTERAAQILMELAEVGDTDRIRLSAVNSLLDRTGVVAPVEVRISASQQEHDIIKAEALETMSKIQANLAVREQAQIKPGLSTLMVIEGTIVEPTTVSGTPHTT